jgi:hypothetical protein
MMIAYGGNSAFMLLPRFDKSAAACLVPEPRERHTSGTSAILSTVNPAGCLEIAARGRSMLLK